MNLREDVITTEKEKGPHYYDTILNRREPTVSGHRVKGHKGWSGLLSEILKDAHPL